MMSYFIEADYVWTKTDVLSLCVVEKETLLPQARKTYRRKERNFPEEQVCLFVRDMF